MDVIILIFALGKCVSLVFFSVPVEGNIKLTINTSVYEEGGHNYYAHVGESVTLTCIFPERTGWRNIYKGTPPNHFSIVENGNLVSGREDRYQFLSYGDEFKVTIRSLKISDSSYYRCRAYECWKGWCTISSWLGLLKLVEGIVNLDVKEDTDDSAIPDFCLLVNEYVDGIFFIGYDLILRCPTKVTVTSEDRNGELTREIKAGLEKSSVFNFWVAINLTENLNNTRLTCLSTVPNNDVEKLDYCRRLPNITVYNELLVTLLSDKNKITKGEGVNFTCRSQPCLPFAVQWIVMDNGLTLGNVTKSDSETSSESWLSISSIDFRNSTLSSLKVVCNVTIGSVSSSDSVSITFDIYDVSTTTYPKYGITYPESGLETTLTTKAETIIALPNVGKDFKPSVLIFPALGLVPLLLLVVALIFVYKKVIKQGKENEPGHTYDQETQNTENREEVCDVSRDKVQLGLTEINSEVTDNVAYVSFETKQ